MAHDFAKLRATERMGSGHRRRGAAPRGSESSGSHWSWFFTGLFSGLFAAFVAYLAVLKPTAAEVSNTAENSELAVAPPAEQRPDFDFYDYLPAAEVAVNVEPLEGPPGEVAPQDLRPEPVQPAQALVQPAQTAAGAVTEDPTGVELPRVAAEADLSSAPGGAPEDAENAMPALANASPPASAAVPVSGAAGLSVVVRPPANDEHQYLLQAGSFQSSSDAESHRARIILLNMNARVVPGVVSGQTWYRVQVGPFEGRQSAEAARDNLAANAIESIPLRMKN